jgi:hypothetical protein
LLNQWDANRDGAIDFTELSHRPHVAEGLERFPDRVINTMVTHYQFGAGQEDLGAALPVPFGQLDGDPASLFSLDSLRILVNENVLDENVRKNLLAKLHYVEFAERRGDTTARNNALRAFADYARAQNGHGIPSNWGNVMAEIAMQM